MSLPKKGSRKIKVNRIEYLWIAKGNGQDINLIIAPKQNGVKIICSFDYDTEYKDSHLFANPFVITPYVVGEVIRFALNKGYSPEKKTTQMNLGNLTKKLKLNLSGERKTKQLIKLIESRIQFENLEPQMVKAIRYIIKETQSLVQYGEWFVGFEIMVSNLDEINFKVTGEELALMKEIFKKAKVDYRKDWAWIEEMK